MIVTSTCEKKGQTVKAKENIKKGEEAAKFEIASIQTTRDKYSIQFDNQHIILKGPGILINHSCDANTKLVVNNERQFVFTAIKNINKDEELSWNYLDFEDEISTPFVCHCGSDNCRGLIFRKKILMHSVLGERSAVITVKDHAKKLIINWNKKELSEYTTSWLYNKYNERITNDGSKYDYTNSNADLSLIDIQVNEQIILLTFSDEATATFTI